MSSYWDIIIPLDETNLITNPSIETNTTGYTKGGTNTIAQSSTQQRRGVYSLRCTYTDNAVLASYAITLTAVAHVFAVDIYIPSDWDSDSQITAQFVGFASMTGTTSANADMTIVNAWQRIWLVGTPDAGDLVGTLEIQAGGSPTATEFIYTDGWHCSTAGVEVTYLDGDQDGCYWLGARHASKSRREALSPAGGKIKNLADDLNFHTDMSEGSGHASVENLSSPLALQPGTKHEGQNVEGRIITIPGTIEIANATDALFHSTKQALIRALTSTSVKVADRSQPRKLRYTGATVEKEISAVYDSGLEGGKQKSNVQTDIPLRLVADDPLFYDIGDTGVTFAANSFEANGQIIMARKDGLWSVNGPPHASGTYTDVRAILKHSNGLIYIGGNFTNFDNITGANYIVAYNPVDDAYEIVGSASDLNNIVYALAEGADGTLYVGGTFTNASAVANADYIATWNGTAWAALGNPNSGGATITSIKAISIDGSGNVYVGGDYTNLAGTANNDYICYWNGSIWKAMSTGANAIVNAIVINNDDTVYIGGDFTTPQTRIMSWDGSAFAALSSGANAAISALALDANNNLYAGGSFNTIGGNSIGQIAMWNGADFLDLGGSLPAGSISTLAINSKGQLWVAGTFSAIGQMVNIKGIAIWNGSAWVYPGVEPSTGTNFYAIAFDRDDVYIGSNGAGDTLIIQGSTTVSYSGTAPAYPIVEIQATSATRRLRYLANLTTDVYIYIDYIFQDDEDLILDFRPGKESITSTVRGDVWSSILPGGNFGQFFLMPGNDGNQDNVLAAMQNTLGGLNVFVRWRNAYISQD